MTQRPDFCTPDSKLSYKARAVIYELWNYDHADVWGPLDPETLGPADDMLEAERKTLCAAWDAHRDLHGAAGLRRDVSPVYATQEGREAVAEYYAKEEDED